VIVLERTRITRIVAECDVDRLKDWVKVIEKNHAVYRVHEPQKTLVMAKARDSATFDPFYLGEVLATECTVKIDDNIGFGLLIGDQPERTYMIAVVDAAFNGKLPEIRDILPSMMDEERGISEKQEREFARSERTRVNFETMGDVNG
jgi:alpha-D-ribose 1-methylphosphonate 5-triphosphate synthase subunit PhnG